MSRLAAFCLLGTLVIATGGTGQERAPQHEWLLHPDRVVEGKVAATHGGLRAQLIGPINGAKGQPPSLVFNAEVKEKHGIHVTDTLADAKLPTAAISVEAWVRIDRLQEWGGLVGAFQDNGAYEKGWLLGYQKDRLFFAVHSAGTKKLTYLNSRSAYAPGCWYHVIGTYDGKAQRVYVDGELQAESKEQSGAIVYPPKAWLMLGAYRDDDEWYGLKGRMESASIHDRAIPADEVKKRFVARKSLFPDIDPIREVVDDWPTYQRDYQRSGRTDQKLNLPLHVQWRMKGPEPQPAWPEEAKNDYYHKKYDMQERVDFDRANHVVGVGNRVYFGSSRTGAVYAVDGETGKVVWTFATDGPVRLAPSIAGDRLLFGSDDGSIYCLDHRSGRKLWAVRGSPSDRLIPGNGRMISERPIRTDVLVEGSKAYVCSGIFPSQGVEQLTLNLDDGAVLHRKPLTVTAQGYLERVFGKLMISTGRNPGGTFALELKASGKPIPKESFAESKEYPYSFISAGDLRIAGGDGKIAAFRPSDGVKVWSAAVHGRAYSLAVIGGRLYAATDRGELTCFGPTAQTDPPVVSTRPEQAVPQRDAPVERILGGAAGYTLLIRPPSIAAAESAARASNRQVVVVVDPASAEQLRRRILAIDLADRVRVVSLEGRKLPFSDMTFNDVWAFDDTPEAELIRLCRPGSTYRRGAGTDAEKGNVRPSLVGAGEWSHMYGDPGNSGCSNDRLVTDTLQLQWFGKPGPRGMVDRHHRTVSPVSVNGLVYVPGEDTLTAVDIYNGTIYWIRTFPGSRRISAFRDSTHLVASADAVYLAGTDRCTAIDPKSGKDVRTFPLPGSEDREWGITAVVGDTLIGSSVVKGGVRRDQNHQSTLTTTHWDFVPAVISTSLFAFDRTNGRLSWQYEPADGAIINPSFACSPTHAFVVESGSKATKKLGRSGYREAVGNGAFVTAVDLATGKPAWRVAADYLKPIHHNLFGVFAQGKLILVGSRNTGPDKQTDRLWYDVHVLDSADGKVVWTKSQNQHDKINCEHGEQERHPTVVGTTLFCEPYAYNLADGSPVEWKWPWTNGKVRRGCGTFSASANSLFFRSDTAMTYPLSEGKVKPITSESRPGCWINVLPVGGLIVAPEASSGCSCNYSVQTSLALIPIRTSPGKKP